MAHEAPVPETAPPSRRRLLWVALVLIVLVGLLVGLQLSDDHDASDSSGAADRQVPRAGNTGPASSHAG